MSTPNNTNKGYFVDGKNQAVEILRMLSSQERERILNDVKKKNPALAKELSQRSLSFSDVINMDDQRMTMVFKYVSAPVIALAIANISPDYQRRVLRSIDRAVAEEAFNIINSRHTSQIESERAQNKILEVVTTLCDKKMITI